MTVEHAASPICAKGAFLSFFHHILTTFIFLSPFFFKEYKVQLGLVLIGQKNIGHCITTIKYNEICKKDSQSEFKNIFSLEKFIFDASYIQWIVLLFSFYKITTLKAKQ